MPAGHYTQRWSRRTDVGWPAQGEPRGRLAKSAHFHKQAHNSLPRTRCTLDGAAVVAPGGDGHIAAGERREALQRRSAVVATLERAALFDPRLDELDLLGRERRQAERHATHTVHHLSHVFALARHQGCDQTR
jgi:hypothetical protein